MKKETFSNDDVIREGKRLLAEWGAREYDPRMTPRLEAIRNAKLAREYGEDTSRDKWVAVSQYVEERMAWVLYEQG